MDKEEIRVKVMALAGGTGTGKSTLAAHLAGRGAVIIDGDELAHDLLRSDPAIRREITAQFGADLCTAEGAIDRNKLGSIVFHDAGALEQLNQILHPVILDRIERRIAECRKRGVNLVVIDAALLLEVPIPFPIDLIVALRCGRSEQMRRLRGMGLDDASIEARLDNQRHLEKSFHKADLIVDTGREIDILTAHIDSIVNNLLGEAG